MITGLITLALIVLFILGTYFISAFETLIQSLEDQDIKNLRKSSKSSIAWLLNNLRAPIRFHFAFTVIKSLFIIVFVVIFDYYLSFYAVSLINSTFLRLLLEGLLLWIIYLTFVHLSPLHLKRGNLVDKVGYFASFGRLLYFVFYPFVVIWRFFLKLFTGREIEDILRKSTLKSEIQDIFEINGNNTGLQAEEKLMIRHIVEFGETMVREVMVPRIDMICVESETPLKEVLETIISAGHSRIPVFQERIDNIIGILYAKDILNPLFRGENVILPKLVREAYFVPEAKRIRDLLEEMKKGKIHIAIVVDEYGGTAGMVSMEDLIEEIVGEIQDEYDQEESLITPISQNVYTVLAKITIPELNETLNLNIPSDEADTLGGLIYQLAEAIPSEGEKFEYENLLFIVEKVVQRRVAAVKVILKDEG
ncbi:HlyC/CorC family transporter [bacterium]|nr:HlyC/CorC family transporter [bacterium]